MPTDDSLAGFIVKKQACEKYNRSLRQLGRDFDKALAKNDKIVVDNFRLRLEDGTVLEATEVSKDHIQELRDKGRNPTWFVREAWLAETYGLKIGTAEETTDAVDVEQSPPTSSDTQHVAEPPTSSSADIVQAKDDLIAVLREENSFLRATVESERERSDADKNLMRELHVLLKNMQDRLLPPGNENPPVISVPASVGQQARPNEATSSPSTTTLTTKRKRAPAKRHSKKPTVPASKKRKSPAKQASALEKHVPSLHRALNFLRHS